MREELIKYGYKWLGMKGIDYDTALNTFKCNVAVYMLYEDNTESQADSIEEIEEHYKNGGKFGIELNEYDNYVVFLLGRDYLKDILPYENDIAYEWCVNLAKDFEISDFNVNTRGLVGCLEDYLRANIYKDENNIWSFRKADLYEVCGGVRGVKYDNFE